MNNPNNNNGNSKGAGLCIIVGLTCTILLFICHSLFSSYDMNPLSFFFCMFPLVLGLAGSFCL